MKKLYNRVTTDDVSMDSSFTPEVQHVKDKQPVKKKINAIGKSTEEKLKQKMRPQSSVAKNNDAQLKAKLSGTNKEIEDLEKINEENIKSYKFKSKRNRVVIILLAVMLVVSIATIAVYLTIVRLESNCNFYVHGAEAKFYLNDEEMSKFRAPSNLQGNARLEINIELMFEESGTYEIKFIAKCYQKGVLMDNTLIYEFGDDFYEGQLFYGEEDGYYYSDGPLTVTSGQKVLLCRGVIFDSVYESTLNINNFKMDFHVYCTAI